MAKKLNLIADQSAFDAALISVKKTAHKMETEVQLLLVSAAHQAIAHGNVNWLNAIPHALGKGIRMAAIGGWILAHAPVVPESDKEKSKEQPFRFMRDRIEELLGTAKPTAEQVDMFIASANAVHWTAYKPDSVVPETFDLTAAIAQLVKRAKALAGNKKTQIKGLDQLANLEALCADCGEPASI